MPLGMSHRPLRNRMIEYDLSTSTSCVFNHDLQSFSRRSHALLSPSVCLILFNCCPLLLAFRVILLYCVQLRASTLFCHSKLECFHIVFATPSETVRDLRILLLVDVRLSQAFFHVVLAPTNQDLDFCTLLIVLDYFTAEVCSFRNCLSRVDALTLVVLYMFRISGHMWHVRFSREWFFRLLSFLLPRFLSLLSC